MNRGRRREELFFFPKITTPLSKFFMIQHPLKGNLEKFHTQ